MSKHLRRPRRKNCNGTCSICWMKLNIKNAAKCTVSKGTGYCRSCARNRYRIENGGKPKNYQSPGKYHKFPCGCSGILPKEKRKSNIFAVWNSGNWACRILMCINQSRGDAKVGKHQPINPDILHSAIRKMMRCAFCWRCHKPMKWKLQAGKTPHLHHDHTTGEVYGFTHPHCNPRALENEIDELKKEIMKLKNTKASN